MGVKSNARDSMSSWQTIKAAIDRNILKNAQFYFIATLLVIAYDAYKISAMERNMAQLTDAYRESTKSVLGVTVDGRILRIERQNVDAANYESLIATALRSLIVSRKDITKDYSVSAIKTPDDVLKNVDALGLFYKDYILFNSNLSDSDVMYGLSDKEKNEQMTIAKHYQSYLTGLLFMYTENSLPHQISISQTKVSMFVTDPKDKNRFTIAVEFPSITGSVDSTGRYIEGRGTDIVKATGFIDITRQTKNNPFGIKFTSLNISRSKVADLQPVNK